MLVEYTYCPHRTYTKLGWSVARPDDPDDPIVAGYSETMIGRWLAVRKALFNVKRGLYDSTTLEA